MIEPPSSFLAMQYWYGRYANTILVKMLHCSYFQANSSILPAASRGQDTSLFMTHAQRSLRFCGGFFVAYPFNKEEWRANAIFEYNGSSPVREHIKDRSFVANKKEPCVLWPLTVATYASIFSDEPVTGTGGAENRITYNFVYRRIFPKYPNLFI